MALEDPLFGIHPAALQLQRQRMELIAANIANADTPGFQARDIDFRQVLAATQAAAAPQRSNPAHLGGAPQLSVGERAEPSFRVPMQPAQDGNTVDVQVEQAQFADAALRYRASMGFLDARIKGLITALTGQ
ncbi:flagellar basal body rod protein FlgB [Fontimonas sp. SYSU GA230001]|uniref:flagellar basal body rod protein FlgB n=1 Tax=Fontimonas sp. SYSU GA230001 TaxID=3142450 RepID=UPI0032B31302